MLEYSQKGAYLILASSEQTFHEINMILRYESLKMNRNYSSQVESQRGPLGGDQRVYEE